MFNAVGTPVTAEHEHLLFPLSRAIILFTYVNQLLGVPLGIGLWIII